MASSQHEGSDKRQREASAAERAQRVRVGLPGASWRIEEQLRRVGIDPDRLPILHLGAPVQLLHRRYPPWVNRMAVGLFIWLAHYVSARLGHQWPMPFSAVLSLVIGLVIIQAACDAFITATERLAARWRWDHYVAGTVAEILSTLPEVVVIAFLVPVSPQTAFVVALITIYNNTLVFSLYSYFLPKDRHGRFLMPRPITEAGSQILVAGGAIALSLGLVMIAFNSNGHTKHHFATQDLIVVALLLLLVFAVYSYRLVAAYAKEEESVRETLALDEQEVEQRLSLVYRNVRQSPPAVIVTIFLFGIFGALVGGHQVAFFAQFAVSDLGLNNILTALILALFAGISEYVILWKSHRKREYGIALANAFGGITQVMFLVLPFTLLSIAVYQVTATPSTPVLPVPFDLGNILLLIFLFPTFYVLTQLIAEDHTLGILDTTIMTTIVVLLLLLLVTYGGSPIGG